MRSPRTVVSVLLLLAILFCLTGCASLFGRKKRRAPTLPPPIERIDPAYILQDIHKVRANVNSLFVEYTNLVVQIGDMSDARTASSLLGELGAYFAEQSFSIAADRIKDEVYKSIARRLGPEHVSALQGAGLFAGLLDVACISVALALEIDRLVDKHKQGEVLRRVHSNLVHHVFPEVARIQQTIVDSETDLEALVPRIESLKQSSRDIRVLLDHLEQQSREVETLMQP